MLMPRDSILFNNFRYFHLDAVFTRSRLCNVRSYIDPIQIQNRFTLTRNKESFASNSSADPRWRLLKTGNGPLAPISLLL